MLPTLPIIVGFVAAVFATVWWLSQRKRTRVRLPKELVGAAVAFYEKKFQTSRGFHLVGRIDRVYRLDNGLYVPIDYKGHGAKIYDTDIAQLTLYGWLLRQNGYPTGLFGYIFTDSGVDERAALRVELGSNESAECMIRHYEDLLAGRVAPRKCATRGKCVKCGHRSICQ